MFEESAKEKEKDRWCTCKKEEYLLQNLFMVVIMCFESGERARTKKNRKAGPIRRLCLAFLLAGSPVGEKTVRMEPPNDLSASNRGTQAKTALFDETTKPSEKEMN